MNSQRSGREHALPLGILYIAAFTLVVLHPADAALTPGVLPARFHDLDYRIGILGTISGVMMYPMIGFIIALVTAHLLGHFRVQRAVAGMCGLIGTMFLLGLFLFIFDMVQFRVQIKPQALRIYDVAGIKGMITLSLLSIVFIGLSVASFKQTRLATRRAEREKAIDSPTAPVFATAGKTAG